MCGRAAELFISADLPVGDTLQSPDTYVAQTSATTGLPYVMVRRNMEKIRGVLASMRSMLDGLTRGLDLTILDRGYGELDGHAVSFYPRGETLGVVLPNNSPGVHSLWAPAAALATPLIIKPGSSEPWTPLRMVQAFIAAGFPPQAFCYYPADHAGASEILRSSGRGVFFGDAASGRRWAGDPRIELHGPGYSKILIGDDCVDDWEQHLDVMVRSILDNGGRSCVNASGVWASRHTAEIAHALAERLGGVQPRPADDPGAQIAPFIDSQVATRISRIIDEALRVEGARDLTRERRGTDRLARFEGATYLLPTIITCDSVDHPLANKEFMFPFAAVVTAPVAQAVEAMGPSLVVTAITRDRALIDSLLASPHTGRLNLGPIPTQQVSWDQPHEGNLFEHLYGRRAFQRTGDLAVV
jgi:acyl-CoA reductase-like NAD-dependent aldehyde dehydrogenase